jgi:Xaa-Pro aminopeptidase
MDYQGRQQRLQESLSAHRLDLLLITHLPNIRYLCGFSGSTAALVVTESKCAFFTDGRYSAQTHDEVKGAPTIIGRKTPLIAAAEWLTANRKSLGRKARYRMGIEGEHLTVGQRNRLAEILPPEFRPQEVPLLVEQARMVKDADEIKRIRSAVLLGAQLFDVALRVIRPGIRENEVAAEMEYAARKAGAAEMSFQTIVASGKRSALPHGRASEAAVPARGFVVCDFGVILSGYCSDMTRTVHVGHPSLEGRQIYEAVRDAQQAAIGTVKPGVSVSEVDTAARKLLRRKNLAKYFTHSTGHGVGLEIHEAPRLAPGQSDRLRPGMVITVEPGVYIPKKWGIRIEDMVVVTDAGCEVLTPSSKELIAI